MLKYQLILEMRGKAKRVHGGIIFSNVRISKKYFERRKGVVFAFLFGSAIRAEFVKNTIFVYFFADEIVKKGKHFNGRTL